MTNHPMPFRCRAVSQLTVLLLLLFPVMPAQAQALRPAEQLQFSTPAAPANTASAQQQADFIVVVVNSEPITNHEVRSKMLRAEQQLSQQGADLPPRIELARQVLERMISDKAQLHAARLSGLRIDDNVVENAVQNVAQQNQISIEELRRRLASEGMLYARFREELRDDLLVNRFRQREVDARVAVTDADIDQYLRDQEGSNDPSSREINLAQILIVVPENATPEQVAVLQAKAQQAADRARAGTDFAALVNTFSDPSARAADGQMGLRNADRYPPLFLEATQNLRSGSIAGPVRSGAGFHVLLVVEKRQTGLANVNITQTRARHILLRVTPPLTEAAAKDKLAEIKKRIASGLDFAALARENSDDGSAKDGGDLGWTNPGMFVPEFEQAMNALAPRQLSEPLVTRFGVHLIQVMERREAQLSMRQQRDLARAALREKKQEDAFAIWALEIRGRSYVEYREPAQ